MTTTAECPRPFANRYPTFAQHLALVIASAFAVATGVLLMRVAHDSSSTALAVLQAGGTSETLMGSAFTLAPYFGAILLGGALTFIWMNDPAWGPMNGRHRVGWTALAVIVASMFLSITYLLVGVVVVVAVFRGKSEPEGSTA